MQLVTCHKLFLRQFGGTTSVDLIIVKDRNMLLIQVVFPLVVFEKLFHMFSIPLPVIWGWALEVDIEHRHVTWPEIN